MTDPLFSIGIKTHLAHRTRIYPNKEQEQLFKQACGVARVAYNWAYKYNHARYKGGAKTLSDTQMRKEWTRYRKEFLPWSYEVGKDVGDYAVYAFREALDRFFKKTSKYPRMKKKGKCRYSFYADQKVKTEGKWVRLANMGWIRIAEVPRAGKILSATISLDVDQWFISFTIEQPTPSVPDRPFTSVGLDVGLTTLLTTSDGEKFENPREYRRGERKLKRLSKALSRKKKGSKNRNKARITLAKAHRKQRRRRLHHAHNITSHVVKKYTLITVEANLSARLAKTKLAKSVYDAGWGEIIRQLQYKSAWVGGRVIKADRFFPSSKTCSDCGWKYEGLTLDQRTWICQNCFAEHDRDINAATRLDQFGLAQVARELQDTINSCGEVVRQGDHTDLAADLCEAGIQELL